MLEEERNRPAMAVRSSGGRKGRGGGRTNVGRGEKQTCHGGQEFWWKKRERWGKNKCWKRRETDLPWRSGVLVEEKGEVGEEQMLEEERNRPAMAVRSSGGRKG